MQQSKVVARPAMMTQTFQSSASDQGHHRFLVDKTLYKGIKQNDVSKIIDVSKQGGSLAADRLPNEQEELSGIVIEMRRKYDEVRTQTNMVNGELDKNNRKLQQLRGQETQLSRHINECKQNFQDKQSEHLKMADLVETRVYDLDIYKEIGQRLKKDILILKKRNFDNDYKLKKETIKLGTLKQEDFIKERLSFRCKGMLQSVQRTVIDKKIQRNTKIMSFYSALNRRQDNLKKRQQRGRQIEEVMVKAMSEKLQQEKQWINICFVNLFLKKFLKKKMQRLINQNILIETAYHTIRSSTDIRSSQDFISKFLNREKDYGVLLASISDKETQLQILKTQKAHLEQQNSTLTDTSEQLNEQGVRTMSDFGPMTKQMENLSEDLQAIKSKCSLMRKWALKLVSSFNGLKRQEVDEKYKEKALTTLLNEVLGLVNSYTDRVLGDQNCSDAINQAFLSTKPQQKGFGEDMNARNNRIKSISVMQGDEREVHYDGVSQADYLQHNRRATKKNDQSRRFRIKTQAK